MSDIDLAELRRIAEGDRDFSSITGVREYAEQTLALLDRIESLQAERDEARSNRDTYKAAFEAQEPHVLAVEARLARVTELCTTQTEGIRAKFAATGASPARDLGYADACDDVLTTIRAVRAEARVNVIERARAEASKRWQSRESDRLPIDWLNEGMASGFVLGAQWGSLHMTDLERLRSLIEEANAIYEKQAGEDRPWNEVATDMYIALAPEAVIRAAADEQEAER